MTSPDIPPQAITDLGRLAYETWQRERGVPGQTWNLLTDAVQAHWKTTARAVAEAAAPHLAAAERERLYAELGNDHYVIFTEDHWTVEHSVECRLSGQMPECEYHAAVALIADEYDPDRLGRWKITGIDSEGLPALTCCGSSRDRR